MRKLRIPELPEEWEELRKLHGITVTDIKNDLGTGFLTYYYRLSKGQRVSYWSALTLAKYLSR